MEHVAQRLTWALRLTVVLVAASALALPGPVHGQTCALVASPPADVNGPSVDLSNRPFATGADVIRSFNFARQREGCSVPLSLAAAAYDAASAQQRTLLLVNTVAATQDPATPGTWRATLAATDPTTLHAVAVDSSGNYTDLAGVSAAAGGAPLLAGQVIPPVPTPREPADAASPTPTAVRSPVPTPVIAPTPTRDRGGPVPAPPAPTPAPALEPTPTRVVGAAAIPAGPPPGPAITPQEAGSDLVLGLPVIRLRFDTQFQSTLSEGGSEWYGFSGAASECVAISMSSTAFDTWLELRYDDMTGDVIAQNDDSSGGTNSLLRLSLPYAGGYVITATSYNQGGGGPYTLQANHC